MVLESVLWKIFYDEFFGVLVFVASLGIESQKSKVEVTTRHTNGVSFRHGQVQEGHITRFSVLVAFEF